jgi:geranylgeranyl diphosphate synthase, type II
MACATSLPPTIDTAPEVLRRNAEAMAIYLHDVIRRYPHAPPRLMEAIEYSLMAGGKRLRPALVLESAACTAGTFKRSPTALAAAAAMELIHTFSLVHDDLPAMDDDDLRRGRPTNHKVFGEAMAILAGDAMVTMAFEVLSIDADPAVLPALVKELASAAGPSGMIGGQVLDMDLAHPPSTVPELQRLHRMKTGALLTAACRMGAIAAGASCEQVLALESFGKHVGLAFQIVDDLLDATATPEQMGKATGKDAAKGKVTYPVLMGVNASRHEADQQLSAALDAIAGFGESAQGLKTLARFVVERTV